MLASQAQQQNYGKPGVQLHVRRRAVPAERDDAQWGKLVVVKGGRRSLLQASSVVRGWKQGQEVQAGAGVAGQQDLVPWQEWIGLQAHTSLQRQKERAQRAVACAAMKKEKEGKRARQEPKQQSVGAAYCKRI
mmetsp:Transcript_30471/g.79295  ORF Transcript_30471/g.79295 Transcript_30471/m.79295 type:complete len:133 (-) Transcript_30471:105-503(-)